MGSDEQADKEVLESPFAGLVLHHKRVDYSDPKWDRHTLTREFCGPVKYYLEAHPWLRERDNQFGPAGERMEHIEIERAILREIPPRQWGGKSKFGKPVYEHFLVLTKLMFPNTDITDTLADAFMFFCACAGNGFKILNLIGGQNMSKTAGACRIAYATMFVNPEYTRWTVSNPFDNVASSGVWGEIEVLWSDLGDAWPGGTHTMLFPKAVSFANMRIEFIPNQPRTAVVELKGIKHTGKGKGAKSRKGRDNEELGVWGEIIDEINEIDNPAFLTRVVNSASQDSYLCITAQNYKDPEDMGGMITEPIGKYGGPRTIDELNVDEDLWWHSVKQGVTLRFDGHNSANILAGRVIYPYLFKQENKERIAEAGEESIIYMSQARSFPVRGASQNQLLSRPKLSASRHTDQFFAQQGMPVLVSFCDPAFGGRDKAVWGYGKFCLCSITDAEGHNLSQELLIIPERFQTIPMVNNAVFNEHWKSRWRALGLNPSDETDGADVSIEDQIALQCLEWNRARGIAPANFGYDFSMRPDIVSSMNKTIGFASVAFNYNQPPVGVPLINFKGKSGKEDDDSKALCRNRNSELGMLAADMFLSKCLRGGENIETAITQLCRTHLLWRNNKYQIEDKAEYKLRWNNVSPDHRDVLIGICGMAALRGFRASLKPGNREAAKTGSAGLIKMLNRFKSKTVAKLPSR